MENKSHAFIAGIFTVLLLAATILIGMWLSRDRVQWVPYQIATKLSVPGLNPQAAVRYRGLDVGRVDEIGFDPNAVGQILVHISVQPDTPITQSTFATLGYQGVTGIAYVQLDDDGSKPVKLPSSPSKVARIEMRPSLLDQLQVRGLAILQQTESVAKAVNDLLQPANRETILAAFKDVRQAANAVEGVPGQLQPTLAKLPEIATQAQRTLTALSTLSRDASTLATSLNGIATKITAPNGTLDTLTRSANQIGAVASRVEHETLPLADDARSSIRALNRTLENLNERPQGFLFGPVPSTPGPGEPGFAVPTR